MNKAAPSGEPILHLARDLMRTPVICARADMGVREVAQLMLDNNIGAAPVIDENGAPIGMVSDGDLLGRRPEDKRRSWWLGMLAQGVVSQELPQRGLDRPVREVMSAPLITTSPTTSVAAIAETMQLQHIKRLPVVEGGRIIGIVSRTDLLGAVETAGASAGAGRGEGLLDFLESLIGGASLRGAQGARRAAEAAKAPAASSELSAADLRERVRAFKAENADRRAADQMASRRDRERKVKALLDQHLSATLWRSILEHARLAADNGEREILMLAFPADLCSDGGRRIDIADRGWEETLRGETAEIFARWRDELKPHGFRLNARIVSYAQDGVIGDLGLYLVWGD